MNIQISAKEITDVPSYLAEGKARRDALMGSRNGAVNVAERKMLHDRISELADRLAEMKATNRSLREQLDEKISIIRAHEQTIMSLTASDEATAGRRPAKAIITDILQEFPGITYAQVVGAGRSMPVVEARHTCIYAVHRARPDLSYPQLGAIFGGRDHTTVLFAVRKMESRINGKEG